MSIKMVEFPYKGNHKNQIKIINKAFQSLSFRGDRWYNKTKNVYTQYTDYVDKKRAPTYGAILCIKSVTGDNKYALVQGRYTGKWSFPKGHSHEGELPIECTLRELAEETGIENVPDPIEYMKIGYGSYYIFILSDEHPLIPRDENEIMDTKWVTIEEMENMSLNADASLYRKKILLNDSS